MEEPTILSKKQAAMGCMYEGSLISPGQGPDAWLTEGNPRDERTAFVGSADKFRPRFGGVVPTPTHHGRTPPHFHNHHLDAGPIDITSWHSGCPWEQKPRKRPRR